MTKQETKRKNHHKALYKWIKDIYAQLDDIKRRLDIIEENKSMKKVLKK